MYVQWALVLVQGFAYACPADAQCHRGGDAVSEEIRVRMVGVGVGQSHLVHLAPRKTAREGGVMLPGECFACSLPTPLDQGVEG